MIPIRSKIVVSKKIIEQINHFSYLGCDFIYEYDKDIGKNLVKYAHVWASKEQTKERHK